MINIEKAETAQQETISQENQETVTVLYQYAADLLINQGRSESEVKQILMEKGLNAESAGIFVDRVSEQIRDAKKEGANKDMLYGALWCVGGLIATVADIGFIFWGAIVFGAIQFIKGAVNASS